MSGTNVEFLFKALSPVSDRVLGSPRQDGLRPPFGDHLSQASQATAVPAAVGRRDNQQPYGASPAAPAPPAPEEPKRKPPEANAKETSPPAADAPRESQTRDEDAQPKETPREEESATAKPAQVEEKSTQESGAPEDEAQHDDERSAAAEAAAVQLVAEISQPAADVVQEQNSAEESGKETPATKAESGKSAVDPKEQTSASKSKVIAEADVDALSAARETAMRGEGAEEAAASAVDAEGSTSSAKKKKSNDKGSERAAEAIRFAKHDGRSEDSDAAESASETMVQVEAAAGDAAGENAAGGIEISADEPTDAEGRRAEPRSRLEHPALANKVAAVATSAAAATSGETATAAQTGDEAKPVAKQTAAKVDSTLAAANRLQAQASAGKRAASAGGADESPRVDPARFVGRVAKAFQTAHERGGTLQLRLSPPELGALRLELSVKDGVMAATLETENATARRVLLDHLPALRDRLAEQNIRVERFDVDVRRDGGNQQDAGPQNQQHRGQNQSQSRREPAVRSPVETTLGAERSNVSTVSNDAGINLFA